MTASPELLTVPEAAAVAGVSARTMRRWIASGQVRTSGRGHGRRVVAASISEPAVIGGQEERSPERTVSAMADTETDSGHEADRLADLVRELTARLAEQTGLTAVWMERARVLADQLALAAPPSPQAGSGEPAPPEPTPEPAPRPAPFPWPLPPHPNVRVPAPWLLALLAAVAAIGLLAWPR